MTRSKTVLLVANGDLRQPANQACWPAQAAMEKKLAAAVVAQGYRLKRAHRYMPVVKHGFISSQKAGLEVFALLDPDAPLIVAEAANHIQVAGAKSAQAADLAACTKASLAAQLGIVVSFCGTKADGSQF